MYDVIKFQLEFESNKYSMKSKIEDETSKLQRIEEERLNLWSNHCQSLKLSSQYMFSTIKVVEEEEKLTDSLIK